MMAYLDCFAGISGDMTLGALIDLGVPLAWLKAELERMPLFGFELRVEAVFRAGVKAQNFFVDISGRQPHRHFKDICALIENSPYSANVKQRSLAVFDRLAQAESRIHGRPKEKIHFHEAGAVDTLVDIVGSVLGLEYLGIDSVLASRLPMGSGFVGYRHGVLPIPAPAVLEILKQWPVYGGPCDHETVTPTGAAIVAALGKYCKTMPSVYVKGIGYGSGKADSKRVPNLLRIVTGETAEKQAGSLEEDDLVICQCCIDDMNPEIFGYLMERLFEDGALDVFWSPVFMKKNRPGTKVDVLCRKTEKETIIQRILLETTSLGVRFYDVGRRILKRRGIEIESPWGTVTAKEVTGIDGKIRVVPEYEVCRKIALQNNIPIKHVYDVIDRQLI